MSAVALPLQLLSLHLQDEVEDLAQIMTFTGMSEHHIAATMVTGALLQQLELLH